MIRTWKHTLLVTAVLAVGPVVAMGCGSNDSGTQAATSLTKAQLLKKGDEVCAQGLEEKSASVKKALEELPGDEKFDPSQQALAELGESIIDPYAKLIDEFRQLPAPEEDKAAVKKIVTQLEAGLKKAETDPGSVARIDPFKQAADSARSYGFTTCNF